jgi:8-oxo-dGTP diphosphatase
MGAKDQGASAIEGRWIVIPRAICLVTHQNDLLLLKRGSHKRVYPNRYDGLGGHIERDETPKAAVIREVKEESGLDITNVRYRGVTHIDVGEQSGILLFVYTAEAHTHDIIDSDEGTLEWVPIHEATQKDLIEDLHLLIPRFYGSDESNEPFEAYVSYDEQDEIVIRFED